MAYNLEGKFPRYVYSSASNYVNNTGLLAIDKTDNPIMDILNKIPFTRGEQ